MHSYINTCKQYMYLKSLTWEKIWNTHYISLFYATGDLLLLPNITFQPHKQFSQQTDFRTLKNNGHTFTASCSSSIPLCVLCYCVLTFHKKWFFMFTLFCIRLSCCILSCSCMCWPHFYNRCYCTFKLLISELLQMKCTFMFILTIRRM